MGNFSHINSPIGLLKLTENDDMLISLDFVENISNEQDNPSLFLKKVEMQIEEYFKGKRKEFDIALNPAGTNFQKQTWNELIKIPYGETRSYGEIASAVNNPKAARAIGMANNKNPIPIIIPCHRVIGANKKLVGYGGGIEKKIFLLNLENNKDFNF